MKSLSFKHAGSYKSIEFVMLCVSFGEGMF